MSDIASTIKKYFDDTQNTSVKDWNRDKTFFPSTPAQVMADRSIWKHTSGLLAYVAKAADGIYIAEHGKYLFGLAPNTIEGLPFDFIVSVVPERYWNANGHIKNTIYQEYLSTVLGIEYDGLQEVRPNIFVFSGDTISFINYMESRGIIFNDGVSTVLRGDKVEDETKTSTGWKAVLESVPDRVEMISDSGEPFTELGFNASGANDHVYREQWRGAGITFYIGDIENTYNSCRNFVKALLPELVETNILGFLYNNVYVFQHKKAAEVYPDFPRLGPIELKNHVLELIQTRLTAIYSERSWKHDRDLVVTAPEDVTLPILFDPLYVQSRNIFLDYAIDKFDPKNKFIFTIGSYDAETDNLLMGGDVSPYNEKVTELFADIGDFFAPMVSKFNYKPTPYYAFDYHAAGLFYSDFPKDQNDAYAQIVQMIRSRLGVVAKEKDEAGAFIYE